MNTTYFLNCVAGNVFGSKKTSALPTEYYVGLSQSAPNMDGSGVMEPQASAMYARVKATLSEPTGGVVTNSGNISFQESTGAWGTLTHFAIYDAPTDGNLLIYGELSSPRVVEANTIMTIKAGDLKLSVQNPET